MWGHQNYMSNDVKKEGQLQILLSTFNGEKYLREQLKSYDEQTCREKIKILIRDDGSSDSTQEILQEFTQREGLEIEFGEHLGTNASYQWLLRNSDPECGFFAFSDQDDIWLPGKLTLALEALKQYSQKGPLLFASRSQIVNEALRPTGLSINPVRGISYYNVMVQNVLPGHTQVFNAALRDDLSRHGILGAHVVDWWVYLVASAKGKIIFSEACSVLHRQHGGNAVGYQRGWLAGLMKKLRYIRDGKGNAITCQLKAFFEAYGEELPEEFREETSRYLDGLGTFGKRLNYVRRSRVYRQKGPENLIFRLLYLLGKYDL